MEYNNEQNFQENKKHEEAVFLKEKNESSFSWVWYLILILLLLGLLGWFGFIKGWFGTKDKKVLSSTENPVNMNIDNRFDGAERDQVNAPIENITINTLEGFPVQKQLIVEGSLSGGCTYLNEPDVVRSGNNFYVNLTTRQEGEACTTALVPYKRVIDIDVLGLPAGVYTLSVNGREVQFEIEQDNKIDFMAGAEK